MRTLLSVLFASLIATSALDAQSDDLYRFGFRGPEALESGAGTLARGRYFATLNGAGEDEPGVLSWSLSVSGDNLTFVEATVGFGRFDPRTDAARVFSEGFEKTELTEPDRGSIGGCEGRSGVVSVVVLSLVDVVTLPVDKTSTLLAIDVEARVDHGGGAARLFFVDGCRGSGHPVSNRIARDDGSLSPNPGEAHIALRPFAACCDSELALGFSTARVSTDEIGRDVFGNELVASSDPDERDNCTGVGEFPAPAAGEFSVYLNVVSNFDALVAGAQGWVVSCAVDEFEILGATVEDTAAAIVPDGFFIGGFEKTDVIDPSLPLNDGQTGVVSAIVLSFGQPANLPHVGTESVLQILLNAEGAELERAALRFQDGIGTDTAPFRNGAQNLFTVDGRTKLPCELASARFVPAPQSPAFVPGDANADRKVDIADPVWILLQLFNGGAEAPCRQAGDANADEQYDVADPIYLFGSLFLGGPLPVNFSDGPCDRRPNSALDCVFGRCGI